MGKNRDNKKTTTGKKSNRPLFIILLIFIIIVPATVYFINEQSNGNSEDKSNENPYDEGTAAYYDWIAAETLEPIAIEIVKVPTPYKFLKNGIDTVEAYCWRALDLDTTFTSSWEKLGYVYGFMHGRHSLLVLKSLEERGLTDEIEPQEDIVAVHFFKSNLYYDKALEFGSKDSAGVYYAKAKSAKLLSYNDDVVLNLQKAFKAEPDNKKYETELIEAYLYAGLFNQALAQNEQFKKKYPDHEFSYRTLGGYYHFKGEEEVGVFYYEKAAELGSKPEVGMLLHNYFLEKGDTEKANYYLQKAYDARVDYQPE